MTVEEIDVARSVQTAASAGPSTSGLSQRRLSPYEAIKHAILSGEFEPGQPLVEVPLAEWCGTSRTPIREALRRLQQDGLVQQIDRGLAVMIRRPEEILDIYETRIILEADAARVAAERRTTFDLRLIRSELDRSLLVQDTDLDAMVDTNERFHQAVWQASHNECLTDLLQRLQLHLGRYRGASLVSRGSTLASPGRWQEARIEHRQILDALEVRDSKRVHEIVTKHFMTARDLKMTLFAGAEYVS
ncbi:MAG TPA: GntR family transcriptional regulator [Candidatus Nanopelagicaceae bacterium]